MCAGRWNPQNISGTLGTPRQCRWDRRYSLPDFCGSNEKSSAKQSRLTENRQGSGWNLNYGIKYVYKFKNALKLYLSNEVSFYWEFHVVFPLLCRNQEDNCRIRAVNFDTLTMDSPVCNVAFYRARFCLST